MRMNGKQRLTAIFKCFAFFLLWAVLVGLGEIATEDPALWRFGAELFPLLWTILITAVFCFFEKGTVRIPLLHNLAKGSLTGLLIGLAWIFASAGLVTVFGFGQFTPASPVSHLWLWLLSAFLNTIMQELLVRGYLYQLLKGSFSLPVAAIATTALFTLMHGGAFAAGIVPVCSVITMSLFMTALYEYTETLAAPIFAHAAWNLTAGILLGCDALAADYPSVLIMRPQGSPFFSGGAYQISASFFVLILNTLLFVLFLCLQKKKHIQKPQG